MASLSELSRLMPHNAIPAYHEETAGEALAAAEAAVGRRIMIWWETDAAYYGGTVVSYSRKTGMHRGRSPLPTANHLPLPPANHLPLTSLPPPTRPATCQRRPPLSTRPSTSGLRRRRQGDDLPER